MASVICPKSDAPCQRSCGLGVPCGLLPTISAVNVSDAQCLTSEDELVQITNWFDFFGQECEQSAAVTAVAGPSEAGLWFAVNLADYNSVVAH